MKDYANALLFCLGLSSALFASEGLVLNVTPLLDTYSSGSAVDVAVTIANNSVVHLGLMELGDIVDYDVSGTDEKGVKVPATALARRRKDVRPSGNIVREVTVPPKQTIRRVLRISMFLDLTLPGRYTIAIRTGATSGGARIALAGEVQLRVIAPEFRDIGPGGDQPIGVKENQETVPAKGK